MNAYAAAYTDVTGDEIVYFGQERNGNDGDANVGFWFLQDPEVDCSSEGGQATDFTGHHPDGDVFIVSAFTAGGDVSGVTVYRWNGDDTGSLGPPRDSRAPTGSHFSRLDPPDDACGTVSKPADGPNGGGTIETPWVTANSNDGLGHSLRTSEFFKEAST